MEVSISSTPGNPPNFSWPARLPNDVQTVFWYLNDRLYGKAKPTDALFFKPMPGALKISCADDKGRSRDIRVVIRNE